MYIANLKDISRYFVTDEIFIRTKNLTFLHLSTRNEDKKHIPFTL